MSPDWSDELIMISTWLVQTSNIILYSRRWANRGSIGLTTFPEMVSQKNEVFRRLLAIQRSDFDGGAKINYFKSRRIRQ